MKSEALHMLNFFLCVMIWDLCCGVTDSNMTALPRPFHSPRALGLAVPYGAFGTTRCRTRPTSPTACSCHESPTKLITRFISKPWRTLCSQSHFFHSKGKLEDQRPQENSASQGSNSRSAGQHLVTLTPPRQAGLGASDMSLPGHSAEVQRGGTGLWGTAPGSAASQQQARPGCLVRRKMKFFSSWKTSDLSEITLKCAAVENPRPSNCSASQNRSPSQCSRAGAIANRLTGITLLHAARAAHSPADLSLASSPQIQSFLAMNCFQPFYSVHTSQVKPFPKRRAQVCLRQMLLQMRWVFPLAPMLCLAQITKLKMLKNHRCKAQTSSRVNLSLFVKLKSRNKINSITLL